MAVAYIGIGTNLGARDENLKEALALLNGDEKIDIIAESSIKETKPVDYAEQPDFLNQVAKIKTEYKPQMLLNVLKNIELKMGRKTDIPKGPRIIDLDILLYDDLHFDEDNLKIPHPAILERAFVIEHLIELDPHLVDPLSGDKFVRMIPKWRKLK